MTITNPVELRSRGIAALVKELGPLDTVRFLYQFETGTGDYTQERESWLKDQTIPEIAEDIRKRRNTTE